MVDDDPSGLSLSVVDCESIPPRSRTCPDRSGQQRWYLLSCFKVTDVVWNVRPSNREQDLIDSGVFPPQARFPQKDALCVLPGRSPILQLRPDLGLKISAVVTALLTPIPPIVRMPEVLSLLVLRL